MEARVRFQISGLAENQLWIIYATNKDTADHMAALFRRSGYLNVIVEKSPDTAGGNGEQPPQGKGRPGR